MAVPVEYIWPFGECHAGYNWGTRELRELQRVRTYICLLAQPPQQQHSHSHKEIELFSQSVQRHCGSNTRQSLSPISLRIRKAAPVLILLTYSSLRLLALPPSSTIVGACRRLSRDTVSAGAWAYSWRVGRGISIRGGLYRVFTFDCMLMYSVLRRRSTVSISSIWSVHMIISALRLVQLLSAS